MEEDKVIDKEVPKEDSKDKTIYNYVDDDKEINTKSKIVYKNKDLFTTFPFYQDRKTNEIKQKYSFGKISFEGLKGKFPSGFIKNPKAGYGATSQLKPLMKFISKKFQIDEVLISKTKKTQLDGKDLTINFKELESIRKFNSALQKLCREKNNVFINNSFVATFPKEFSKIKEKYQKGTVYRILSEYDNVEKALSTDDKSVLLKLFEDMSIKSKDFFEKQALATTKEKIEEKIIEDVLSEFKRLLGLKKVSEEKWQEFFKSNAWIFTQLFAYPTVLFKDKAYVGGKSIQNKEGKIVDFLYTNKLTQNSALIEIKKHTTKLLSDKPYRGSDVYNMHKELSGAINQVLDQKDTYAKKFDSIKGENAIQSFNPKCIILIGRLDVLDIKQHKAFELLRSSFKDIEIITFDELFARIQLVLSIFKREDKNEPKK